MTAPSHTRRLARTLALALGVTLLVPATTARTGGDERAIAVVVAADNPTRNLSLADLRRIFRGERALWPDGTTIVPILPPSGTPEKSAMLAIVYQCDEAELRRFWIAKVYEGAVAEPPTVAEPGQETIGLVSRLAGAIAFVATDRGPLGDVAVVTVEGRRPGDPDYPLRASVP